MCHDRANRCEKNAALLMATESMVNAALNNWFTFLPLPELRSKSDEWMESVPHVREQTRHPALLFNCIVRASKERKLLNRYLFSVDAIISVLFDLFDEIILDLLLIIAHLV